MSLIRQCLEMQGPKKIVVVFDGGGVRGKFALELCQKIAAAQRVPLSQLFGMVVGVSVGAVIASVVALGHLDNSDSKAPDFMQYVPKFFAGKNQWQIMEFIGAPRYDGKGKAAALQSFFGDAKLGDAKLPLAVLCSSFRSSVEVFCSWNDDHKELPLWQLLDASTAAPTYFPIVEIRGTWLFDGGVRANKPLANALLLATQYFDRSNLHFVSIGTAYTSTNGYFPADRNRTGLLWWLRHGILEILIGNRDDTFEKLFRALFGDKFLRLECQCDDIQLDNIDHVNLCRLSNAADFVWDKQGKHILAFLDSQTAPI